MDGIKNYLTDMDGVILQGSTLLPRCPFRGFRDDR